LQDANLDALSRNFSVPHCEALVFILVFHSIATPLLNAAAELSAANMFMTQYALDRRLSSDRSTKHALIVSLCRLVRIKKRTTNRSESGRSQTQVHNRSTAHCTA
jgi:hypothetical protein